jgi:hypothetical protein
MAGDLPGYEEANRVLFSSKKGRLKQFEALVESWPKDVRTHLLKLFRRTLELEKVQSKVEPQEAK